MRFARRFAGTISGQSAVYARIDATVVSSSRLGVLVRTHGDVVDWWIVKQLRAMVLTDVRDFVPQGYFESAPEKLTLRAEIEGSDHFSRELRWGYLAADLGRKLFFESTAIMSARQVSACEVLMHLGMLAGAEAAQGASTQLAKLAKAKGVTDGNAGAVAEQLRDQHVPTLLTNVEGALKQYLRYLTSLEAEPFLPLLGPVPDDSSDCAHIPGQSVPDEEQKKLDKLLDELDPRLRRRREGAWGALRSKNPDRLSQAANSMVELLDQVIAQVCKGTDLATYLKDKFQTHQETAWVNATRQWIGRTKDNLHGAKHHVDSQSERLTKALLKNAEAIVLVILE